jgi:hypothetical protein
VSPVVLRVGRYRLSFYAADRAEPAHVHVFSADGTAKFWLEPGVALSSAGGYDDRELRRLARLVHEHRDELLRKWHEFFGRR